MRKVHPLNLSKCLPRLNFFAFEGFPLVYHRKYLTLSQANCVFTKRPPIKSERGRFEAINISRGTSIEDREIFKICSNLPTEELTGRKLKLLILDATQGKAGFEVLQTLLDRVRYRKLRLEGVGPTEYSLRFLLVFVDDVCLCLDTLGLLGNGRLCPLVLKRLLTDPRIVKVGNSAEAVASKLYQDYGLRCGPIVPKYPLETNHQNIVKYLSTKYNMELRVVCDISSSPVEKGDQLLENTSNGKDRNLTVTKVIQSTPAGMEKPKLATMITDISQLNLRTFTELETVNIYIVESLIELEQSLRYLHKRQQISGKFYVGFDTEGCSYSDKMGLIQIAFEDVCLLIRIHQIMKQVNKFPEILRDFLEDEEIIKVGVNVTGDVRSLDIVYGLRCKGNLDIDRIIGNRFETSRSLAELTKRYVEQFTLDKTPKKRTWFDQHLDQQDILYAAKDAIAGYIIYEKAKSTISNRKIRDQLQGVSKYRSFRIKLKR